MHAARISLGTLLPLLGFNLPYLIFSPSVSKWKILGQSEAADSNPGLFHPGTACPACTWLGPCLLEACCALHSVCVFCVGACAPL